MPASQAGRRGFESHRPLFDVIADRAYRFAAPPLIPPRLSPLRELVFVHSPGETTLPARPATSRSAYRPRVASARRRRREVRCNRAVLKPVAALIYSSSPIIQPLPPSSSHPSSPIIQPFCFPHHPASVSPTGNQDSAHVRSAGVHASPTHENIRLTLDGTRTTRLGKFT
jgi:hypothetical protein